RNFEEELGELEICQLNLSSLTSIKKCAQRLLTSESTIHILINNAGVFLHPFEKTEDGFETHFQVNYLGHFLLTLLLLPKIQKSAPDSKIINVSSLIHKYGDIHFEDLNLERHYSPVKAYSQSKLANILFTKELDRKLKTAGIHDINVYSLHPGVVKTELARHVDTTVFWGARLLFRMFSPFIKSAKGGAQTTIHCAVDENAAKESGLYYE
ncbi:Retinol dehydrogenase 12, partial [Habropoda laboriosa]